MEKIFFILILCIVVKYFLSIFLICKKLKEWSYVTEVTFSIIMLCIASKLEFEWYITVFTIIIEYFISKALIYINIVFIKEIAFRLLVGRIRNGYSEESCSKLKYLYQIEYGRKLKHGLPNMVRQEHERTGVKFDRNGFPKFKSYYTIKLDRKDYKASREHHFYKANKILYKKVIKSKRIRRLFTRSEIRALRKGQTPYRYTWHHHQNRGKMQLVSREIHSLVNHIGGYSIWGLG